MLTLRGSSWWLNAIHRILIKGHWNTTSLTLISIAMCLTIWLCSRCLLLALYTNVWWVREGGHIDELPLLVGIIYLVKWFGSEVKRTWRSHLQVPALHTSVWEVRGEGHGGTTIRCRHYIPVLMSGGDGGQVHGVPTPRCCHYIAVIGEW